MGGVEEIDMAKKYLDLCELCLEALVSISKVSQKKFNP
jgi:hypothetical protein